jgi:protein SCO1/2
MRGCVIPISIALCVALASAPARAEDAPGHRGHGEHRALAGDPPARDLSLYALPGSWTDQNSRPVALSSLRGSPVLLVLFYGTCDSVCPTVVRDVQRVEALLTAADRSRTRVVLVTIDPQVDTPERLLAFARKHQLDGDRWSLLNGPPEQVRVLANVLGVKYRPTGSGQYSHTVRITVLDRDGAVVEHADGLERPLAPIAARVSSLLAEPVTPPHE